MELKVNLDQEGIKNKIEKAIERTILKETERWAKSYVETKLDKMITGLVEREFSKLNKQNLNKAVEAAVLKELKRRR